MKEREISLIDMIFEILLQWRKIIFFMIIGGVLLGGYSFFQSVKSVKDSQVIVSEKNKLTLEQLEEKLTIPEKNRVTKTIEYEKYYEELDKSILMQMDSQNVPTANLIFCLQTSDEKNKNIMIATYTQLLTSEMSKWLIQKGMKAEDATQINKLLTIENDIWVQENAGDVSDKGSIYISVIHIDEASCRTLVEYVKEFIENQKVIIKNAYGEHEISLVNETYAIVPDGVIAAKKLETSNGVISGYDNINVWKSIFSEQQMQYYNILKGIETTEMEEGTIEEAFVVTPVSYISIKYVIIGMGVCAFLYVIFVFISYIFNNRLRANDNLTELYEIPQLGSLSTTKEKKRFMSFVDTWIIRLRDRNKRKFTQEEEQEITAVAIKMAAKKAESKEVYLIGCEVKKQTADICDSIKANLEKENIKVSILDNVLYNAEEMEKLSNAKYAVLVEKTGSTMYDEVVKEVELLQRNKITILGGVLVD